MNRHRLLAAGAAVAALGAAAGVRCQGPDARHAWAIHDRNRPNPAKVEAREGRPPSDAVVLFDGTRASAERNWYTGRDGTCRWEVVEGALRCVPKAGNAVSRRVFADCQLHLEWRAPKPATGRGQGRGNSGVILFGAYEIQVLDSYLTDPSKMPNPNPNNADGQAGAVYAQNPPLVNPARPEGVWQSYDLVFHAPVWDGDALVKGPTVTLFFNGVLVQDNWEFEGSTYNLERRPVRKGAARYPILLQDHGAPVEYRNIWVREIPSVYANTVQGGPGVKAADVAAQREKTAARLFARLAPDAVDASALDALLEILSYSTDARYRARYERAAAAFVASAATWDAAALQARAGLVRSFETSCDWLVKGGTLAADDAFVRCVRALAARLPKRP